MSRPAYIAPLDAAIADALARYDAAELKVQRIYDRHIAVLDAIEAELEGALRVRSEAYMAVDDCEKAIRKLGYVVLGAIGKDASGRDKSSLGDRTYSDRSDKESARERARVKAALHGEQGALA